MAPEPAQFVHIRKICPRCNNTDGIKFMYLNNKKINQPRYRCKGQHGCREFFTLGGKIRAPPVVRPQQTRAASTAAVAADRRTGPDRRGRPRRSSERVTRQSGAREIRQETPATRARPEAQAGARTVATCARTEARTGAAGTLARPTSEALGLPRIPRSEQHESPSQSSFQSSVVNPAVRGRVPTTRVAGLVPRDVVDAERTASRTAATVIAQAGGVAGLVPRDVVDAERTASRTAATVIAQAGDVTENWREAVLRVSPYGLAPASDGNKKMKLVRIKYGGKESVLQFWA